MPNVKNNRRGLVGMTQGRKPKKPSQPGQRRRPPAATAEDVAEQTWMDMMVNTKHPARPLWGEPRLTSKGWTPSTMGDECDRQIVLRLLGYRGEDFSAQLLRMFSLGNAIETVWREKYRAWGILLEANAKKQFAGPPHLSYEIDVLVKHPFEKSRKLIGEIKSANVRSFKLLPPKSLDPQVNYTAVSGISDRYFGPRVRKYMLQLMLYLYASTVTKEGFLLFDCKNDSTYRDFYLTLDVGMPDLQIALDRTERLTRYWADQMVPACTHGGNAEDPLCSIQPKDELTLVEMKKLSEAV